MKLFYRGPEAVHAADAVAQQQLLQVAAAGRDDDTFRFLLFEQMLLLSKKHVALLWLAFAVLPGAHTPNLLHPQARHPSLHTSSHTEASIFQAFKDCNTMQTFVGRLYTSLAGVQASKSVATFDPRYQAALRLFDERSSLTPFSRSVSNQSLVFAQHNSTVTRPGSVSSYPLVRAPIQRGPKFNPFSSHTFTVCLDRAPNNSNSTSFGVAAKSINVQGSDGVGPTPNSWGVICTMGEQRRETKVVASGRNVATWRMLAEGDVLLAQYFPDGALVVSLNHFECQHRFQLPAEAVARFGVSSNAAEDEYTFAMTLASDHCARIM